MNRNYVQSSFKNIADFFSKLGHSVYERLNSVNKALIVPNVGEVATIHSEKSLTIPENTLKDLAEGISKCNDETINLLDDGWEFIQHATRPIDEKSNVSKNIGKFRDFLRSHIDNGIDWLKTNTPKAVSSASKFCVDTAKKFKKMCLDVSNLIKDYYNASIKENQTTKNEPAKEEDINSTELEEMIRELLTGSLIISTADNTLWSNLENTVKNADTRTEDLFKSLAKNLATRKTALKSTTVNANSIENINSIVLPKNTDLSSIYNVLLLWQFIKFDLQNQVNFNQAFSLILGNTENLNILIQNFDLTLRNNLDVFSNMHLFGYNFQIALQYVVITKNTQSIENAKFVSSNLDTLTKNLLNMNLSSQNNQIIANFFLKYKNYIDYNNFGFDLNHALVKTLKKYETENNRTEPVEPINESIIKNQEPKSYPKTEKTSENKLNKIIESIKKLYKKQGVEVLKADDVKKLQGDRIKYLKAPEINNDDILYLKDAESNSIKMLPYSTNNLLPILYGMDKNSADLVLQDISQLAEKTSIAYDSI